MPNLVYFMPKYFNWLYCYSTDANYFNLTLPQTGTEHQNKNIFDERVHTRKIDTINCIFIPTILNFRLQGQQSLPITQTSKIKMASSVKRPCFALIGQNNLWGCFHKRKRMFCSIKASGTQFQPTFCWFSSTNEHKNITNFFLLMDACLVSCFWGRQQCHQFKLYKHFQGIHSCLSPVEILDLKTPCLQISSSKIAPLPLEFWKAVLGMGRIFSGIVQFNSKCKKGLETEIINDKIFRPSKLYVKCLEVRGCEPTTGKCCFLFCSGSSHNRCHSRLGDKSFRWASWKGHQCWCVYYWGEWTGKKALFSYIFDIFILQPEWRAFQLSLKGDLGSLKKYCRD